MCVPCVTFGWFRLAINELDSLLLYCQGFIFTGEMKSIIFRVPLSVAVILDASVHKWQNIVLLRDHH